jgi:methyl-accepting chemotaxis protein
VIGSAVAVAFTILLSVFVQRSITSPLRTFVDFAERIGAGDLTQRANFSRGDELGQLADSLDRMALGLKEVATKSTVVSEDLNAATSEILASTQQQAASTAEQAAAVQQANVTMSQLSQSGAQISDRAKQVAAAAEAVSTASVTGLESVRSTNSTMEGIREQAEAVAENVISLSEKTQAVGEIIASVNEIAERSHLLALNASIQAAAAGEHGRSFSVVASEMKNLAAQSKQATVQVRGILGDIQRGINTSVMLTEEAVKRTETGKQQADSADRTIRKLTENLEESIRAFQQIVAGSAQQQIGFEQVTQAFRSIGIAAQETATSTKQSEKAAANLSTLSQQLRETVRRYRV